MGNKKIHSKADEQLQDGVASYTGVVSSGIRLPEQYRNLIYSKWLRSYRFGNEFMKLIDSNSYYKFYHEYISRVLAEKNTIVCLAVLTDDRDVVLGFSVSRGTNLDYVHVHKDNRRLGIGTFLLPKDIDSFTHLTKTGMAIWNNKYPSWKCNPFF